jgi:site-specific recombinase XerD
MSMKVLAVKSRILDLSESMLNEECAQVSGKVKLTGAGVFDEEERLLPLISSYLTHGLHNGTMALASAVTYGRNLGYSYEYLRDCREFAGVERDYVYLDVGSLRLKEYMSFMRQEEGLTSKTVRNRDACLASLFDKHLCIPIDDVPPVRSEVSPYAHGFLSPSPKQSIVEACSLVDLKELILSTQSERERCLLQFIFDSGVRRSEIPRISLEDINEALRFRNTQFISADSNISANVAYCPLRIRGSKGRHDEMKDRDTIVSRATLERVKKYHASPLYKLKTRKFPSDAETPAFLNSKGTAYSPGSISKLLERVSERAVQKLRIKKNISPHKLRHGNAHALLRSPDLGKDALERLVIVQKTLGHSNIETTQVYTQVTHDVYQLLCRVDDVTRTKSSEMEELSKQTRLEIRASTQK